jgi:hypothetical protein
MARLILPTASVEILPDHNQWTCDICCIAQARYNVFDGNTPLYACGTHIGQALRRVATIKGG